ncbi:MULTISPECIES: plasmid maintenance protein CcdB [Rahnella]|jgi:post-segregation antitoxin (ccd killing protein)|uniref:CcdB antidote CcdA n=1 Tax=Rahnella sp. (strain Y9602) TaxID=2703885 RepID=A0A0H3F9T3_RAHSY|nr:MULTISPECIES: plasmid maintenance protein CcdB [Rahnella]AFE58238.1 CcdB antidote CcdA [Rahnella aquatilis HX2]MDP9706792.1 post-segregation antitoxin (ccd killing protein) [Rahnella aquatilis]ADW73589.1 CcdB antidote CcdA [Rahnella aceris]MBU9861583.1 plasmid maintenance protein CcdB [Rahnella aceris]MCM2447272.1 type II toxin-antitoxin system CcdA family antitoxin [Rahnella sp. CG8]
MTCLVKGIKENPAIFVKDANSLETNQSLQTDSWEQSENAEAIDTCNEFTSRAGLFSEGRGVL